MEAVCMGVKEMGIRTGHRGTYNQSNESRYAQNHCGAIKEASACNKMEIAKLFKIFNQLTITIDKKEG